MSELVALDTGVIKKTNPFKTFQTHWTGNKNLFLTHISVLELLGVNWIEFLKKHGLEKMLRETWEKFYRLEVDSKEIIDLGEVTSVLQNYLKHWKRREIFSELSEELNYNYTQQKKYFKEFIKDYFDNEYVIDGALKEAHINRFLTLLPLQVLFAPETANIYLKQNERQKKQRELLMQFFLLQSVLSRFREETGEIAHLWPTYISIQSYFYEKGQAVDIEFYDMLFFGALVKEKREPITIYTTENKGKLEKRLLAISKILLRVGGDIQRNPDLKVTQPPLKLGNLVCLAGNGACSEIHIVDLVQTATRELREDKL